jgi:hypothetical protein
MTPSDRPAPPWSCPSRGGSRLVHRGEFGGGSQNRAFLNSEPARPIYPLQEPYSAQISPLLSPLGVTGPRPSL